ncbi:MAG: RteC domain-containing protein [Flavobacterium sp.]|nr:RteC domain-containing protein [Flavobacterium sp.]
MNNDNFDIWILEHDFLIDIYNEIAQIKQYLPNFEYFTKSVFDFKTGIYEKFSRRNEISKELDLVRIDIVQKKFISEINEIIKNFDLVEQTMYYKILFTRLHDDYFETTDSILEEIKIEKKSKYVRYSEEDYISFSNKSNFLYGLTTFYELKFKQQKYNLPFTIEKKIISQLLDADSNLSWFIDISKEINLTKAKSNFSQNTLTWNGSQIELIELAKALIENGNFIGTQKDIINKISNAFNFEIKNPSKTINDLKNRSNGSETLFLDKLKKNLLEFITN